MVLGAFTTTTDLTKTRLTHQKVAVHSADVEQRHVVGRTVLGQHDLVRQLLPLGRELVARDAHAGRGVGAARGDAAVARSQQQLHTEGTRR